MAVSLSSIWCTSQIKKFHTVYYLPNRPRWRIQGGEHVAHPTYFAKYFEKSPKLAKIYQKNLGGKPQKPWAPPFFQILDPPLGLMYCW